MVVAEPLVTFSKTIDQDTPQYEEVGTEVAYSYFTISAEIAVVIPLVEATDEELLYLVEKSGAFAFWESPEEDVYTVEDGSPL